MAEIQCPWIEPVGLLDMYLRLVANPRNPEMNICAVVPPTTVQRLAKGVSKREWLAALGREGADTEADPVITIVPMYHGGMDIEWVPLNFSLLPKWLAQFDALTLKPGNASNISKCHSLAQSTATGNDFQSISGMSLSDYWSQHVAGGDRTPRVAPDAVQRFVVQRLTFAPLFIAHLHPSSEPLTYPLVTRTQREPGLDRKLLAKLLFIDRYDTSQQFYPMASLKSDNSSFNTSGHANADDHHLVMQNAERRAQWRQIRSHGQHAAPTFFGKQWMREHSMPDTLYAGIELEMQLNEPAERRMLSTLFCVADEFGVPRPRDPRALREKERLHCERDGSIQGIEAPLMPHEIGSYHGELFWRKMWNAVCEVGATNSSGKCGMHIHVNGDAALSPPPGFTGAMMDAGVRPESDSLFKETAGFFICLTTAMLSGGPEQFHFQPRISPRDNLINARRSIPRDNTDDDGSGATAQQRPTVSVFGRPAPWDGNYARSHFSMCRRTLSSLCERYRATNWGNDHTIEFRIFGPQGFKRDISNDWLNVCTQLTAAIVHFSRMQAFNALVNGAKHRTANSGVFYSSLPKWLKPMLLIDPGYNAVGMPGTDEQRAYRYAMQRHQNLWLVGVGPPPARDSRGLHRDNNEIVETYMGSWSHNRQWAAARRAQVYACCMRLWEKLFQFMRNESPNYDIALAYLERVEAWMPNAEQTAALWARESDMRPSIYLPAVTEPPSGVVGVQWEGDSYVTRSAEEIRNLAIMEQLHDQVIRANRAPRNTGIGAEALRASTTTWQTEVFNNETDIEGGP